MAQQTVQVVFTAEQGPKPANFPAPLSALIALGGPGVKITVAPFDAIIGIACDAPIPGTPNWTFNVTASAPFTGVVTIPILDLP